MEEARRSRMLAAWVAAIRALASISHILAIDPFPRSDVRADATRDQAALAFRYAVALASCSICHADLPQDDPRLFNGHGAIIPQKRRL